MQQDPISDSVILLQRGVVRAVARRRVLVVPMQAVQHQIVCHASAHWVQPVAFHEDLLRDGKYAIINASTDRGHSSVAPSVLQLRSAICNSWYTTCHSNPSEQNRQMPSTQRQGSFSCPAMQRLASPSKSYVTWIAVAYGMYAGCALLLQLVCHLPATMMFLALSGTNIVIAWVHALGHTGWKLPLVHRWNQTHSRHHCLYPRKGAMATPQYLERVHDGVSDVEMFVYGLPSVGYWIVLWCVYRYWLLYELSTSAAVAYVAVALVYGRALVSLHLQFHLSTTPLLSCPGFGVLLAYHEAHHRAPHTRFALLDPVGDMLLDAGRACCGVVFGNTSKEIGSVGGALAQDTDGLNDTQER